MPSVKNILFTEVQIKTRVKELAENISQKHKSLTAICVLKGSAFFFSDLCRELSKKGVDLRTDFIRAKSYIGTESCGDVNVSDLPDFHDRDVLIVEDIVDTGRTLKCLVETTKTHTDKEVFTCSFLDKPSRRTEEIKADYTGFEIDDLFVVGYGLDCDEMFRELPYIGVYEE